MIEAVQGLQVKVLYPALSLVSVSGLKYKAGYLTDYQTHRTKSSKATFIDMLSKMVLSRYWGPAPALARRQAQTLIQPSAPAKFFQLARVLPGEIPIPSITCPAHASGGILLLPYLEHVDRIIDMSFLNLVIRFTEWLQ
jgi:hypothetical protein